MKKLFICVMTSLCSTFAFADADLVVKPATISGGNGTMEVVISKANTTAFQFDVALPAGVSATGFSLTGAPATRKFEKALYNAETNTYRFLTYDEGNAVLNATTTFNVTLAAADGAEEGVAETTSVLLVDPDGNGTDVDNSSTPIVFNGVTIEFQGGGKLLMVSKKDLDFTSLGDEVKAYIATGYDLATNDIILTRVTDVPAGTPIWVNGPQNSKIEVPTGVSETYYPKSFIVGSATEDLVAPASDSEHYSMTLSPKTGTTAGVKSAMTIPAGKCYLYIPRNLVANVGTAQTINLTAKDNKEAYVSPCDLDFTSVEGLSAYIVTGFTTTDSQIWLTPVDKASANTPLYLKGKTSQYTVPSSAQTIVYVNMLEGKADATSDVKDEYDGYKTWVLSKRDGVWGPYNTDNPAFPKGKSYLPIPKSYIVTSSASRGDNELIQPIEVEAEVIRINLGSINGEDDDMTGIRSIDEGQFTNDTWYNLKGQRIDTPTKKGLYIKNGKKVIMR